MQPFLTFLQIRADVHKLIQSPTHCQSHYNKFKKQFNQSIVLAEKSYWIINFIKNATIIYFNT